MDAIYLTLCLLILLGTLLTKNRCGLAYVLAISCWVASEVATNLIHSPWSSAGYVAFYPFVFLAIPGQIALHLVKQGQKVCIASFEMKPIKTLERMLRQFSGEYIDDPLVSDRESYITKILTRMDKFTVNSLYLYDQQGTTSPDKVIAMSRYCAMELNVQHIFIDSLMKCVRNEDDFNGQKNFIDELTALARDHNVHVHLVHHIRKQASDEVTPNKNDLKGSGSISDQVDNVFLVWRNKKKENQRNRGEQIDESQGDTFLMNEKQRNGEAQEWYQLWYHAASQQFVESAGSRPMDFDNNGKFRD